MISEEVAHRIHHIKDWQVLIRESILLILEKLHRQEVLTDDELHLNANPSEVAAIWSVVNKTDINPRYVREVRRKKRITPSQEWGKGGSHRCMYRVGDVLPIKVGHERGRPKKPASE